MLKEKQRIKQVIFMKKNTLIQFFHWYYPTGGKLWPELAEKAEKLVDMGITIAWLPPAYKAAGGANSVGYDSYDLFDFGEFDQKGSVSTKYGDRKSLENAVTQARSTGLKVIYDVVFNHKMGADEQEKVKVRRVNEENRDDIDSHEFEVIAYTRYTFPGRNEKYSKFVWDYHCFSGLDHVEIPQENGNTTEENGIFKIMNDFGLDGWNDEVNDENGNYDYLMGNNVELRNKAVREELKFWGRWVTQQFPCDGFRLDAVKHIPAWFYVQWLDHVREQAPNDLFVVAEYWSYDVNELKNYLEMNEYKSMLFDAPLHAKFHNASTSFDQFDMSKIFEGSLVEVAPEHAVTLVENHDTQPLQSLEAPVETWFKSLAYALILLREKGTPCIFYADLYGAHYKDKGGDEKDHEIVLEPVPHLEQLIRARQQFANGVEHDYFDDPHCIAFVRDGTADQPGCIVIMTNGDANTKTIQLAAGLEHHTFRDYLGNNDVVITSGDDGKAEFSVGPGSVSVWVLEDFITNK